MRCPNGLETMAELADKISADERAKKLAAEHQNYKVIAHAHGKRWGVCMEKVMFNGFPTHRDAISQEKRDPSRMENAEAPAKCPKCGGAWKFYDGALGYESQVCSKCGVDINDLQNGADEKSSAMVKDWLQKHKGDREGLAKWMRDSLRLGSIEECRELIRESVGVENEDDELVSLGYGWDGGVAPGKEKVFKIPPKPKDMKNGYQVKALCPSCSGKLGEAAKPVRQKPGAGIESCDECGSAKDEMLAMFEVKNGLSAPWTCDECREKLESDAAVKAHKLDTGHSSYKGISNAEDAAAWKFFRFKATFTMRDGREDFIENPMVRAKDEAEVRGIAQAAVAKAGYIAKSIEVKKVDMNNGITPINRNTAGAELGAVRYGAKIVENERPLTGKCICGHPGGDHAAEKSAGSDTPCSKCRCAHFQDEGKGPRQIGGVGL